ncbi:MAG TPA: lysine--tRNA ligase, partial [Candidatus Binataceae bacterium]
MSSASQTSIQGELWPYEEARKLAQRVSGYEANRPAIFESGFGPSGLPHLGTMAEVLRPSYVRHAFELLNPSRPSRLIVFIDDMDGLRKVPESIPNRESMAAYVGQPVSRIPDPFGCCRSFSEHMIGLLIEFLRPAAVDYELMRSSEAYGSGRFDHALRLILEHHQEIINIIAPTLRNENRVQWSPFMPICPTCGQVNSTLVTAYHPERNSVEFSCERSFGGSHGCGFKGEQSVLGGLAKVQWKVDWALRWFALRVDYELYGKDLTDSAPLSGQIVRLLGGNPPLGFVFEMFLDEEGHKVSKSVGRGVTVDQWLRYAPIEVLKYFLILNPRRARKLFLEAIPQYVDEYLDELRKWAQADPELRRLSGLEFVLQPGSVRNFKSELSFGLIMNLVSALGSSDPDLIWNYVTHYDPALDADTETKTLARRLVDCALNFYRDFIEPTKQHYTPNAGERAQIEEIVRFLSENPDAPAEEIEKQIYEVGRRHYDKPGKIFPPLYKVLLGQNRGPRLGVFIKLATPQRIIKLL